MPIPKQGLTIPIALGMNTKDDPKQLSPGVFPLLTNVTYDTDKMLKKRNGNQKLTAIGAVPNTLTTYKNSLNAMTGTSFYSYTPETARWANKGAFISAHLNAMPVVRSATNQSRQDVVVDDAGLACAVWLDSDGTSKYQIIDSNTGNIVVAGTSLESGASSAGQARCFVQGSYFIITYTATVSAASRLRYIAIPRTNPTSPSAATSIDTGDLASLTTGYDAVVSNGSLYVAYTTTSPSIKFFFINYALVQSSITTIASRTATYMSLTADSTNQNVWLTYWDTTNSNLYAACFNANRTVVRASTVLKNSASIVAVTATATGGILKAFYETNANYGYTIPGAGGNALTHYVSTVSIVATTGTVSGDAVLNRGVALASKAFIADSVSYVLLAYGANGTYNSNYQPTYFLVNSSGQVVGRIASSNGGGYPASQVLASATVIDSEIMIGYLFKDLITPVNKEQNSTQISGIYSQTGINLATFTLDPQQVADSEIGNNLHITGSMLWMYDGMFPVEHGFNLWPEDIGISWSATGGSIHAQPDGITNTNAYCYQVTYEWTDAQGNIHRSAPSIPLFVTTTSNGTAGSITLKIPTLRLTYKTTNKVRIVIYRWSAENQVFYQITSVSSPTLNDVTTDSITYVDTQADASILGNQIIYTNGGVVENICAPACTDVTLFRSRLVLIDSEDENLLWYSKQVTQGVPVEMSDLFSIFVNPTVGAQGSTGPSKCVAGMDDKLIIFKANALYYMTGTGPDTAGNQNDFSEPIFINSTVGCSNSQSIVFIPSGLMFQSGKGIWLLGRDLATTYIGAPVEAYNDDTVLAAVVIPGTNEVRFTLESGVTLMYDYYYNRWAVFQGIPAITSTLYGDLHTYADSAGNVFQETPGQYLDGTTPVLIGFTTGWLNLAGLQGYQRAFWMLLLGEYITPHKLSVGVAYDYNTAIVDQAVVIPDNFSEPFGDDDGNFGDVGPFGGPGTVEDPRIFFSRQRCQAIQITVQEIYDPSMGIAAGQGLSLSGLNLVVGAKRTYRTSAASKSFGASGGSQ